jgi:hypothetical protein
VPDTPIEAGLGAQTEPIVLSPADERSLLSAATRAAGARLLTSRVRSIHQRPQRSRSVVYEAVLEVEGQRSQVLLVSHVDLRGYPERAFVLAADGLEVAVWRFPFDPYLPGLPPAISPVRVRELLDQLGAAPGAVTLRTRAYRPTRRAVVEVRIDGPVSGRVLYVKVLPLARARSVARRHRQLATAGLPVPRLVGLAEHQGIVAIEALGGPTLTEALRTGAPLPAPAALVELSQRFAVSEVRGSRDPRAFADPLRHVTLLSELLPHRGDEIAELAQAASEVDAALVGVHGDLHPGQLLLGPDGEVTGVLDVDGAGQGYLAHDAGNLLAHLRATGELHPSSRAGTLAYASQLEAAYTEVVGAEPLARATAAAWLGLATSAHRAQEPSWREQVEQRIDRAAQLLGRT